MRVETRRFGAFLRVLFIGGVAVALWVLPAAAPADEVDIRTSREGERGRLIMTWPSPVDMRSDVRDGRLILRFDRPIHGDFARIDTLREFVGAPALDQARQTVSFPLNRGVAGLAYAADRTVFVDLTRERVGAPQEAPPDAVSADEPAVVPKIPVQTGQHRGFSRVLFQWDRQVGHRLERTTEGLLIEFDRPVEIDAGSFERRYLKYIRGGDSQHRDGRTRVILRISPESAIRDRTEGRNVIIDVLAPVPVQQPPEQAAAKAEVPPPAPAVPVAPAEEPPAPAPSAAPSPPPAPAGQEARTDLLPDLAGAVPTPPASPAASSEPAPPSPASTADPAPPPLADTGTLRIDWDRPVAAAIFRRGDAIWAVFDQPSQRDTAALTESAGGIVRRIDQRKSERATVLRIEPRSSRQMQIERDGLAWLLRFGGDPAAGGGEPIEPIVERNGDQEPRLLLPVAQPGEPLALDDPAVGETMVVIPVIPRAAHVGRHWSYPQFRLSETEQGIVVHPRIDTLRVRSLPEGVEISTSDGLAVSPAPASAGSGAGGSRSQWLLDPEGWASGRGVDFVRQRQALERAIVVADDALRERLRLRLAQFLLGHGFAAEAIGALQVAAQHRTGLDQEPLFLILRGAAQLLSGRVGEARNDFAKAAAADASEEAKLWAVAGQMAAGEPSQAADLAQLPQWTTTVLSYPSPIRGHVALLLAESAIAGGRVAEGQRLIEVAQQAAPDGDARSKSRIAYLEGRRKERAGDTDGALAAYDEAARLDPRRGRVQAELARTQLALREGRIAPAEAAAVLEGLRHAWRGDALEFHVLRELGQLQLQAADYAAGLRTLKLAVSEYPKVPGASEATGLMSASFERLFLEDGADALTPVAALALWEEFKELTPPGERGREMVRKLAERLVAVDLLERAASLLESLLPTSGGAERASLGARLAEVLLMDGKPEAALDALRRTASPAAASDLSRSRALTQARALLALNRNDEALSVLARDEDVDAQLLRARIFRAKGEWTRSAAALRRVVEAARADPPKPLDHRQARDVLDLAVALTLSGNMEQLAQLDASYRGPMADTSLNDVFRLIAGTVPPPDADAAALADLVDRAIAFRRGLDPATAPLPPR